ncbi:MAG: alpha/beta hydrolase [Lachnospiraceae bacterium]|nr:alpha/beta hydrolase [Lachnospiraceae bacterium]
MQGVSAKLKGYLLTGSDDKQARRRYPAVIILPGGAYRLLCSREEEPVAYQFLAAGVQAFILEYTVWPQGEYPTAQCQVLLAIEYIRNHAEEFCVDPNRIGLCGFSAGGHLAASVGAFWNDPDILSKIGDRGRRVRPDRLILCYPVITSGEYAHIDSIPNLLGSRQEQPDLLAKMSLENQVTAEYPPVLIWHTQEDQSVPVENALLLVNALVKEKVPVEFHLYPRGAHGLALGTFLSDETKRHGEKHPCSEWVDKAVQFLYE